MTTRRRTGVAVVLLLGWITACGASDDSASAPGTSPPSVPVGTPTSGPPSPDGKGKGSDDGFAFLPWGPDDPPIPAHYAALAASKDSPPGCADAADTAPGGAFWATVVAVCKAMAGDGAWPTTTTVPKPPPAPNSYQKCLDAELSAMLQRALRWHADHLDRRPIVAFAPRSGRSSCQSRIYAVRVLDESDLDMQDPPDGIALAITGAGLGSDPVVTVDGKRVEVSEDFQPSPGLKTLVVFAKSTKAHLARVEVATDFGVLTATVDLPGSGASPTATSGTLTPSPGGSRSPTPAGSTRPSASP